MFNNFDGFIARIKSLYRALDNGQNPSAHKLKEDGIIVRRRTSRRRQGLLLQNFHSLAIDLSVVVCLSLQNFHSLAIDLSVVVCRSGLSAIAVERVECKCLAVIQSHAIGHHGYCKNGDLLQNNDDGPYQYSRSEYGWSET